MTARLGPALTALDVKVLRATRRSRSVRARHIVEQTGEDLDTVRGILRGLERYGYVTQAGGWWRRA